MKLSDRKELIREIFNDEEIVEIRAALSDRYDVLTKMAEKEEKHGRKYDDPSWPRKRLALLDGDGWRGGVIDVFNPLSKEEKTGDLFEDEQEDEDLDAVSISSMVNRPNSITPEYENTPDICPHTEILDETKEGGAPHFRCTLCGQEIAALGAPAGDSGDAATVEADFEIVQEGENQEAPPPPTLEELDALTLEELGVPTRARNVLARRGIKTAADYLAAGDAVLRMPGVGEITLNDINQALRDRGLTEQAAREIEAQLVAVGRMFAGAMSGGETEEVNDVQASEDTLPWEQVGLALGNSKPAEPEEIIVLEPGDWPEGPPMVGQRIHDVTGRRPKIAISAVSERFVLMTHPDTDTPIGSLRLEDMRWSPTLGCWALGAPATAGV